MRRVAVVLTALLLAAVPAGCGSEDTEEDRVRAVASDFFAAAAGGDGERACELVDRDFRETVGEDCPKGLTDIFAGEAPEVTTVQITGDRATAKLSTPPPDDEARLVRQDGEWRVLLSGD